MEAGLLGMNVRQAAIVLEQTQVSGKGPDLSVMTMIPLNTLIQIPLLVLKGTLEQPAQPVKMDIGWMVQNAKIVIVMWKDLSRQLVPEVSVLVEMNTLAIHVTLVQLLLLTTLMAFVKLVNVLLLV